MHHVERSLLVAGALTLAACGRVSEEAESPPPVPPSAAPATSTPPSAPGARAPGPTALGESVYANQCAMCHGPEGRGDGPMVGGLTVKPRSFAADEWRFVDFTAGADASRTALEGVIRAGIPEAMMPPYDTRLSNDQMRAVVDHVLVLRARGRGG